MVAWLLGGASVSLEACLLPEIGVSEKVETTGGAGGTAGAGGTGGTGAGGPTGCIRATYPPPPTTGDGPSMDDLVVAFHSIDMGDTVGADPPGLDLDFTCTCFEEAGDTCTTGASKPRCDGPGGVDNAGSKLFQLVVDYLGDTYFGSDYYSSSADIGEWSLLVRISGYNGTPDDPEVGVALFVSPGMEMAAVPKWDGTDAWPISDDTVGASGTTDEPIHVSNGAYVAEGTLVATMPSAAINLSGGTSTITVRILGGVISGKLLVEPFGARIEGGVIAARWAVKDVFAALSSYRGPNDSKLCKDGSFVYNAVKSRVCGAQDILTDPLLPASAPCDALSLGIGFTADPALLGPVVPAAVPSDGCPDGQDPADDFCQ